MKKLVIVLMILCLLSLLGCTVATAKGDDAKVNPLHLSYSPHSFDTEEAFHEAIQEHNSAEHVKGYSLKGLDAYYGVERLPEGMTLTSVTARDHHVTMTYGDDQGEKLTLIWLRGRSPEDSVSIPHSHWVTAHEGYRIHGEMPYYGYGVEKIYDGRHVFFEQDGQCFQAIVPVSFTKEDIIKHCVAKKLTVNS